MYLAWRRRSLEVLRWRGSRTVAPGGVAVVANGDEKLLPLPLFPVCFLWLSQWLPLPRFVFGFRFRFLCFWFVTAFPSVSFVLSLLPLLGSLFSFFLPVSLFGPLYL